MIVAADMEDGDLAGMGAGDRLVAFEALELAFVGLIGIEMGT